MAQDDNLKAILKSVSPPKTWAFLRYKFKNYLIVCSKHSGSMVGWDPNKKVGGGGKVGSEYRTF
jgi:hypothetical protein